MKRNRCCFFVVVKLTAAVSMYLFRLSNSVSNLGFLLKTKIDFFSHSKNSCEHPFLFNSNNSDKCKHRELCWVILDSPDREGTTEFFSSISFYSIVITYRCSVTHPIDWNEKKNESDWNAIRVTSCWSSMSWMKEKNKNNKQANT